MQTQPVQPNQRDAFETRIASFVADQLMVTAADVVDDARLMDDLGADSLDVVELAMALEAELSVIIHDDDLENLRSFGDLLAYLRDQVRSPA